MFRIPAKAALVLNSQIVHGAVTISPYFFCNITLSKAIGHYFSHFSLLYKHTHNENGARVTGLRFRCRIGLCFSVFIEEDSICPHETHPVNGGRPPLHPPTKERQNPQPVGAAVPSRPRQRRHPVGADEDIGPIRRCGGDRGTLRTASPTKGPFLSIGKTQGPSTPLIRPAGRATFPPEGGRQRQSLPPIRGKCPEGTKGVGEVARLRRDG